MRDISAGIVRTSANDCSVLITQNFDGITRVSRTLGQRFLSVFPVEFLNERNSSNYDERAYAQVTTRNLHDPILEAVAKVQKLTRELKDANAELEQLCAEVAAKHKDQAGREAVIRVMYWEMGVPANFIAKGFGIDALNVPHVAKPYIIGCVSCGAPAEIKYVVHKDSGLCKSCLSKQALERGKHGR